VTKPLSFELNERMVSELSKEFGFSKLIEQLNGDQVNKNDVLIKYGRELAEKVCRSSDEYPDRTYDVMLDALKDTGIGVFPLLLQRCLEISYISINEQHRLPVIESNTKRLVYRVKSCKLSAGKEPSLQCETACLELAKGVADHFNVQNVVTRQVKVDCCEFTIENIG